MAVSNIKVRTSTYFKLTLLPKFLPLTNNAKLIFTSGIHSKCEKIEAAVQASNGVVFSLPKFPQVRSIQ